MRLRSVSLREAIGHESAPDCSTRSRKTLREADGGAEVGGIFRKWSAARREAGSNLLSSIAQSLGLSTAQMLRMVADYLDSVAA